MQAGGKIFRVSLHGWRRYPPLSDKTEWNRDDSAASVPIGEEGGFSFFRFYGEEHGSVLQ